MSDDKILKTKENLLNYCKSNRHYCVAELSENKGVSAMIYSGRMHHILYVIESDHIALHIWPHIHVSEPYKSATSKYIAEINNLTSSCNFRISDFGNLYINTEHYTGDEPVKEDIFKKMETNCLLMLGAFEHILTKLAYGDLLIGCETRPAAIKSDYFYNMGDEMFLESPAGKDHYEFYFDEDYDDFFDDDDYEDDDDDNDYEDDDDDDDYDDDNELINEERQNLMIQRFLSHISSKRLPNPDYDPDPYFDRNGDHDSSECRAKDEDDEESKDLKRLKGFLDNRFLNDRTDNIASKIFFDLKLDKFIDEDDDDV